ncbi:MAG: VOC family protein [Aeromicrobium sp.]|uniref:VOC family protein n=1 Tax=Aeromicrobium sp. TaxID=1871063 RepID=UPI002629971C|nr:VOC family protein [Aeromicrobium sp.]MDF1705323.1 VOC family protein [Aeromicrobium sp.]
MLSRVDHIDVRTPDFDGTVQFFRDLGLEVVRETDPERGSVELALPGPDQVVFEVRVDPAAEKTYVHHVAFHAPDEPSAIDGLAARGISFSKTHALIQHTGRTISNAHDAGGGTWQVTD